LLLSILSADVDLSQQTAKESSKVRSPSLSCPNGFPNWRKERALIVHRLAGWAARSLGL
jgi:hypothetical protein